VLVSRVHGVLCVRRVCGSESVVRSVVLTGSSPYQARART